MAAKTLTDRELMDLPHDGNSYEFVDGEIRMSPKTTARHGDVIAQLMILLGTFVKARDVGRVLSPETGFRMPGGNVRSPDLSFAAKARVPGGTMPETFFEGAPDLAVEVLSPHDREHPQEFMDKIGEYLESGVRLVWVIDPTHRRAIRYRSIEEVRPIPADGVLDGEDVVTGFSCPLAAIFE
jgi:Uma2 family endonuclease